MAKKRAFITGITGQDGSYLAELLVKKGYEVYGFVRRVALEDESHRMYRLKGVRDKIALIPGSLESYPSIYKAISSVQPDEVYHLAAQSYVSYSFDDEFSTLNTNINGTHFLLSSCKEVVPKVRFYFAASSEMFGNAQHTPQTEITPFAPRSTYGISKVAGFHLVRNYRDAYGLFACNGICFNHESPRRGYEFVTKKISSNAAKIKLGLEKKIRLGNIDARRDWGHAEDYVEAMWAMLQPEAPDDYVIATGKDHSVRDFLEAAFRHVGLHYKDYLETDETLYRPAEVRILCGDASKAKKKLGWVPRRTFEDVVKEMVDHDLDWYSKGIR